MRRPAILAAAVATAALMGCPPPSGPEGPAPPPLAVPEPSETDLRDFRGADRDAFLAALDDLRRGRAGRAARTLQELERDVRESPALRAASALAEIAGGAMATPLEDLEREASRASHSRFVVLCYALAAEVAGDPQAAYEAIEDVLGRRGGADAVDAEDLANRAAKLRHQAAMAHLDAGRRSLRDGDVAAALQELEVAASADPADPAVQAALGNARLASGNAVAAVEALEKARAAFPGDVAVSRDLATALLQAGRLEEAKKLFGDLVAANPSDEVAKTGLEEARAALRRQSLPARFRDLAHMPYVTRAEVAALLIETLPELKDAPQVVRGVVVTDLSGSWAKDYVLMVMSRGLMEAYEDHTFGPEERVSRADLASALAKAVEALERRPGALAPAEALPPGTVEDLPRGHGRYGAIIAALHYGLMDLTEDRAFRPADAATGREAVEAAQRLAALVRQER